MLPWGRLSNWHTMHCRACPVESSQLCTYDSMQWTTYIRRACVTQYRPSSNLPLDDMLELYCTCHCLYASTSSCWYNNMSTCAYTYWFTLLCEQEVSWANPKQTSAAQHRQTTAWCTSMTADSAMMERHWVAYMWSVGASWCLSSTRHRCSLVRYTDAPHSTQHVPTQLRRKLDSLNDKGTF